MTQIRSKQKVRMFNKTWIVVSLVLAILILLFLETFTFSHPKTLTVTTRPIPVLKPHRHSPGDSVFDPGHMTVTQSGAYIVPQNVWIKSFDIQIKNGNPRNLHHLVLVRLDQNDNICPNYDWQPIMVASSENSATHQEFPENYRLFLPKGTPLLLFAMLHNPLPPAGPGGTYANVQLQVKLNVDNSKNPQRFKPVELYRLHLADSPCTNNIGFGETFDVPANTAEYVKKPSPTDFPAEYTFQKPGTIIAMGGHIHPFDRGKALDVYINNNLVHSFTPKLKNDKPWSWEIDPLFQKKHVGKGDTISIEARYSNPNPFALRGEMGMMVFYFAKD